jgi:ATP-dependent Zn protease
VSRKIAFIGAGSVVFTRNLVRDILTFPALAECTIALMDINEENLALAKAAVEKIIESGNYPAKVLATTDRVEALKDADGVLCTISEQDRKVTAYHEAGHALITKLVAPENRVSRITIIPSTKGAGGFSMNIPPDRMYYKKKDMENSIKIALAGRAAEELIFGEANITTGASNDLEKATGTLLNMVRRFGMNSKSGLLNYDVLYNNGFRQVQEDILEECKTSIDKLYNEVKELLQGNKKVLEGIAENLLARETLDEKDLDLIIKTFAKAG